MSALFGILLRAAVVYVYLLVVLRLTGKRTIARGTPFDLIVALIISDLPDNMIYGQSPVAQGIVAITTIAVLHLLVAIGVSRSPFLNRILGSLPTPIVAEGKPLLRNLRFERINDMELDEALREAKIDSRVQVQQACLEPSGVVTVRRTPESEYAQKRDIDL